ncbi:uncharacterized protein LOC144022396 [Festucalex cinctus]
MQLSIDGSTWTEHPQKVPLSTRVRQIQPQCLWNVGLHGAAIHAGVVGMEIGGECIVTSAPKQNVYNGSTSNGITSRHYDGPTASAFTFADEGFCYKAFEDNKTWADAQRACRSLGAKLVSIGSKIGAISEKRMRDLLPAVLCRHQRHVDRL